MGVRIASGVTNVLANPLPASNAETIVCQTPPIILAQDFGQVLLFWFLFLTSGTGTTSFQVQIRRGLTLTSPLITVAASLTVQTVGNNQIHSGCYIDTPGAAGAIPYSLTLIQAGATAAGLMRDQQFLAIAL